MPKILSVEDDPDFQYLISGALRRQGWDVHYAFTGKEGYEKALELQPDLLLLDMMLPVYTGAEVAEKLKANPATRDTPIIVVTAFPDQAGFFEGRLKATGVVAYLRKPVDIDELVSLVRRTLNGAGDRPPPTLWRRGVLRLSSESRSVWVEDGLVANLSPRRFEVLYQMMQTTGAVKSKDILGKVWNGSGTLNDLQKTVQRLRKDLGVHAGLIRTVRGGYRLEA